MLDTDLFTKVQWTDALVAQCRELRANGYTYGEIAGALKISKNAIIGKLDRLNLKINLRRPRSIANQSPRVLSVNITTKKAPCVWADRIPLDEPAPLKIPLMELGPFHCRKVVEDEKWACDCSYNGLALYCGLPTVQDRYGDNTSYCAYHHKRFRAEPRR